MIKPLLVIAIIVVLIVFVGQGLLSQLSTLHFSDNVTIYSPPNIGVYWDQNCTNTVSSIHWGELQPGSAKNATFYIRNEGNHETTLSLNAANWQPADMSQYMNLTWNYNGTAINPDHTIQIALTLKAEASPEFINYIITNDVTAFTFDIVINANA